MPNTFELIASSTVGAGGAANITFSSIAGTYTDLCVMGSLRTQQSSTAEAVYLRFNGLTTNLRYRLLLGSGSTAASYNDLTGYFSDGVGNSATASTFSNFSLYIPNYSGSNNKSYSADNVSENNATTAYAGLVAGLWSNSAAITSITLIPEASAGFVQYSTAYLYGVKNA